MPKRFYHKTSVPTLKKLLQDENVVPEQNLKKPELYQLYYNHLLSTTGYSIIPNGRGDIDSYLKAQKIPKQQNMASDLGW